MWSGPYCDGVGTLGRAARPSDINSWLELVIEVEGLFGPAPTFEDLLRRAIGRGTAIVVDDHGLVAGGALLSADGQPHRIHWLAVRQSRRGRGVGSALVSSALERWRAGDVDVVTFTSDVPAGAPARRLYERFGFVCRGRAGAAPDGAPRDLFVLTR